MFSREASHKINRGRTVKCILFVLGENEKEIVVFDGLNSLIRHKGIHSVCKLISTFTVTSGNGKLRLY